MTGSKRFAGRVAVVTGAAQGLGFAVAERLGAEGARIVIADCAADATDNAVRTLREQQIEAIGVVADLSSLAGAERVMDEAVREFGSLDVLVNNVGGTIWKKPFWHYTEAEVRAEVDRSFWPTLWCSRAAIGPMSATGDGAIVNIGSNASTDGVYRAPYSACKGAVESLTSTLAVELADLRIRVNCVSPGRVIAQPPVVPRNPRGLTEQEALWEMQFVRLVATEELLSKNSTAEELAGIVAFVASHEARHLTGETIQAGRRGIRIGRTLGGVLG